MLRPITRAAAVLAILALLLPAAGALAHDSIIAGVYKIDYGWLVEPPVLGQPNAITLNITRAGHSHGTSDSHGPSSHSHGSSGASEASLIITSPADGADVPAGPVEVLVALVGEGVSQEGLHWHLYVDGGLVAMEEMAQPRFTLTNIAAGQHELRAILSDANHAELGDPHTITINVAGSQHNHVEDSAAAATEIDVAGLRLEIVYGGQSKLLILQPLGTEPGRYQARLTPTRAGVYSLHLSGRVGEVEINEVVQPEEVSTTDQYVFPEAQASLAEVREQLVVAQAQVSTARWIAIAAAVLGLVGAASGLAAILRRQKV
jgi:hypothetical protein